MWHQTLTTADIDRLKSQASSYPGEVMERLSWFAYFLSCKSISQTCRHFAIARTTFYRWMYKFNPADLSSLQDLPTMTPAIRAGKALGIVNTEPAPSQFAPALAQVSTVTVTRRKVNPWAVCKRALITASVVSHIVLFCSLLGAAMAESEVTSLAQPKQVEDMQHALTVVKDCRDLLIADAADPLSKLEDEESIERTEALKRCREVIATYEQVGSSTPSKP